jgi:hypothetical protein
MQKTNTFKNLRTIKNAASAAKLGLSNKLKEKFMLAQKCDPSLIDWLSKEEKTIYSLDIIDPMTEKRLCTIRNPRCNITGFKEENSKCVDLHKFMRETNITPDFGFDADEPVIETEKLDPWDYMCGIILPKCR